MLPRLTHIALHVRYLEAMVAFYEEYYGFVIKHDRRRDGGRVVWLAAQEFVIVLIDGGPGRDQAEGDFSHLGFALAGREAVDAAPARAGQNGCPMWSVREGPYPVGYYCGLRDPDGNFVELSYGQPLGPGAANRTAGLDGATDSADGAKT